MIFFKQRSAKLFNGQTVRPGDNVQFTDSDGKKRVGRIQYDPNNTRRLFFWNNFFEIVDYRNAVKV